VTRRTRLSPCPHVTDCGRRVDTHAHICLQRHDLHTKWHLRDSAVARRRLGQATSACVVQGVTCTTSTLRQRRQQRLVEYGPIVPSVRARKHNKP
jgi:hypothetical protein